MIGATSTSTTKQCKNETMYAVKGLRIPFSWLELEWILKIFW